MLKKKEKKHKFKFVSRFMIKFKISKENGSSKKQQQMTQRRKWHNCKMLLKEERPKLLK